MSAIGRIEARRTGSEGFTLIEMLVVLAVLGLIGALAFPAVDRALDGQRFRLGAGEVAARLHATRAAAIAQGVAQRFAPGVLRGGLVVDQPQDGIVFYGDGSANGGNVTIADSRRRARLAVDGPTGTITRAQ